MENTSANYKPQNNARPKAGPPQNAVRLVNNAPEHQGGNAGKARRTKCLNYLEAVPAQSPEAARVLTTNVVRGIPKTRNR